MKFEGIIYDKANPYYKIIGYYGQMSFLLMFSMIFFGSYFNELEDLYSWFKIVFLLTLLFSVISYFFYAMIPKYKIFSTVKPIFNLIINDNEIKVGVSKFDKDEIQYLKFIGKDYPNISGGMHSLFSSDGSDNRIILRTSNKELSKKFLISSEESLNQLIFIVKKWKEEGVNIESDFDLV